MTISHEQRHNLLMAERWRNAEQIAAAIAEVLEAAPNGTMLDAEMTFRAAGAKTYLVANGDRANVKICIGVDEMLAALDGAGRTPAQNRQALAAIS